MISPYFVPADLITADTDYRDLSAETLRYLVARLREMAVQPKPASRDWRERVAMAWTRVARQGEKWQFSQAAELLAELEKTSRMSSSVLRESLTNHFRAIAVDALLDWYDQAAATHLSRNGRRSFVFVIAAGNLPGVALFPVIQLSLIGVPVLIKCASSEPWFLPVILQVLEAEEPQACANLVALTWRREQSALTQIVQEAHPATAAFGDDTTVSNIAQHAANAYAPLGDRYSIAIIHAATAKIKMLRQLVYDFLLFDGRGCLSPQWVLVVAERWSEVENLALHLAGMLSEETQKWPAGAWLPEEMTLIQQWRGEWNARRAAGGSIALYQAEDTSWTVVAADSFDSQQRVAFRTIRLWWVKSQAEAVKRLHHHGEKIHALAIDQIPQDIAELTADLESDAAHLGRLITSPGNLQAPPFNWMNIHRSWFEFTRVVMS